MPPPAIGEGADSGTATALGYLIFNAQNKGPRKGFAGKPRQPHRRRGQAVQRVSGHGEDALHGRTVIPGRRNVT